MLWYSYTNRVAQLGQQLPSSYILQEESEIMGTMTAEELLKYFTYYSLTQCKIRHVQGNRTIIGRLLDISVQPLPAGGDAMTFAYVSSQGRDDSPNEGLYEPGQTRVNGEFPLRVRYKERRRPFRATTEIRIDGPEIGTIVLTPN